jgi:ubiquinone/menaquinone biosynthesis C-methylase UbiE
LTAGARLTGVDASAAAVEAAGRRAAEAGIEAVFHVGRAERLPFEGERFDVVLAVTVLCFVHEPRAAVAELARVLRPGGVVVLGELGLSLIRFGRQVDYAACLPLAAFSNSAGLT